jgi:hypothetical protein
MASGQVYRAKKAEHMAAPTTAAGVKKTLANPEPSTHGPNAKCPLLRAMSGFEGKTENLLARSISHFGTSRTLSLLASEPEAPVVPRLPLAKCLGFCIRLVASARETKASVVERILIGSRRNAGP